MGDVLGLIVSALVFVGVFFFAVVAAACAIYLRSFLHDKKEDDYDD